MSQPTHYVIIGVNISVPNEDQLDYSCDGLEDALRDLPWVLSTQVRDCEPV